MATVEDHGCMQRQIARPTNRVPSQHNPDASAALQGWRRRVISVCVRTRRGGPVPAGRHREYDAALAVTHTCRATAPASSHIQPGPSTRISARSWNSVRVNPDTGPWRGYRRCPGGEPFE